VFSYICPEPSWDGWLNDWFDVEGDIDDFIFYDDSPSESER
jgi:hypothetical protein